MATLITGLPHLVALQTTTVAVPLLLVLVVGLVLWKAVVIVDEHETRVLVVDGEVRKVLDSGVHFIVPFRMTTEPIDTLTEAFDVTVDATTQDRVSLTATAAVDLSVTDTERLSNPTNDYRAALLDRSESALAAAIRSLDSDALADPESGAHDTVETELDEAVSEIGMRVESVEIRDLETHLVTDDLDQ